MTSKPCKSCGHRIIICRKAENTKRWTVLAAEPVPPASVLDASTIRVLDGINAYRLDHMREALMLRREIPLGQAHATAAEDFPWHPIHHCERRNDCVV